MHTGLREAGFCDRRWLRWNSWRPACPPSGRWLGLDSSGPPANEESSLLNHLSTDRDVIFQGEAQYNRVMMSPKRKLKYNTCILAPSQLSCESRSVNHYTDSESLQCLDVHLPWLDQQKLLLALPIRWDFEAAKDQTWDRYHSRQSPGC